MTVPIFTNDPADARMVVVAFEVRAVRKAPLPKFAAVTIDGSADSIVELPLKWGFPNLSAGRAIMRNVSPIPRN